MSQSRAAPENWVRFAENQNVPAASAAAAILQNESRA
jgi:hypothetical protein